MSTPDRTLADPDQPTGPATATPAPIPTRPARAGMGAGRPAGTGGLSAPESVPVSAAAVAGLASEIDALRRAVRTHGDLAGQLRGLAETVADLAQEVEARAQRPTPVAAPSWCDAYATPIPDVDPAQAAEALSGLLSELCVWMGRVFLRYPDAAAALPECWIWHPEILEELLWLSAAWRQSYLDQAASVHAAADWHDRYRPGVVRRLRTYAGTCSLANHRDEPAPTHLAAIPDPNSPTRSERGVEVPAAEAAAAIAGWWAAGRPGTGPAPTAAELETAAARWRSPRGHR